MKKLLLAGFLLAYTASYSQITVTVGGGTAAINSSLFGAGVTVSGLTINCANNAYGTFTGSLGTSGMTSGGVVLTTGNASQAPGPNNTTGSGCSVANTTTGDAVLSAAQPLPAPYQYQDRCVLDFTLVPQCNNLSIKFCFASEEYLEYVSSPFNDAFGIFVNGPNPLGGSYANFNMARLPSGQVVSIDNVNTGVNPTFYNNSPLGAAAIMQYDGYTDGLTATLDVTPCATYTFHIVICDAADQAWDSGVFLQFQGLFCSVPALAATTSSTPTTCGGNNGSVTATPTAGTGLTYSWTNAAGTVVGTTTTVTNLPAGTYTVTINDASPCTPPLVLTATIAGSTGPTVTPVAETCAGYNNGSVVINNAVGAGPYTVTINGPTTATVVEANTAAAVASFTNLPDGAYTYTVTGSGGCTNNGTFTIVAGPPCCSVTAAGVNPSCFGGTNGTVTANPTGLAGFNYSWSTTPVQITQTASGLAAGTYTVTMTDASGCSATANVTINQPTQVNGTTVNVNPTCNGGTNGSITVNASAGTPGYTYSINGGAFVASNVFSGLGAGTHTIVIKDANGCTRTLTVTLTNPPLLTLNLTGTTQAVCGVNNGTLTVAGAGGTPGYTYSLSAGGPFGASANFTGLAANTYTVFVHDANNCTATVSATITNSAAPVASVLSQTNLTCAGGANGCVLLGGSGTAPFTYSIDLAGPTPATPFQVSNSFCSLIAGTYTATVKDVNGCTGTVNFTITAPTAISYTSVATPASCFGVCDGQITITPSGGTPPYSFSSNSGVTFSTANPLTGLCAGPPAINVVVKDANGCLANSTVNITQPTALNATYTLTNPLCPNVCNGQIVVATTTGGTTPYQYSVNGGALGASNTLPGLCNGPNTVLVQDAHGCQLSSTQMLVDPPLMTITQTAMVESNCGFPNGSFEIQASGGFTPYNYQMMPSGTSQLNGIYTGLSAGSYEVQVTDNHGCAQTFFAGINDIEMDGILDGMTDITCHGACDGTFFSHATGGIPIINYELDGNGSFELDGDFTGICAGSHVVVMVDNGFCVFTLPFTLVEPDEIFFALTPTNVVCNGGSTGAVTATSVTGGDGVYQYSLNGGPFQASNVFSGLTAGTYTVTVQDGNGCTGVSTTTVTQAPLITFSTTVQDLSCFGNNTGLILIGASGGTGALTYSINYPTMALTPLFSYGSLPAGTYTVTVGDAAGCKVNGPVTVNQPTALAAAYTLTPALCNGSCDGEISVNASGGTIPYVYSSDNGATFQPANILQNLCAGSYQVVVKDNHNCLVGSSINIIEPTAIVFSTTLTDATCGNNNGAINFNPATGGTPSYDYSIDGGVTLGAGLNYPGLAPGNYNLTVEDNNGCQVDATVTIANQASPVINAVFTTDPLCFNDCNGTANISASGGTGALSYSIDGGAPQASNIINGICSGAHVLTVTDANGCTDTHNINLLNPSAVVMAAPVITPLTCYQNSTGIIDLSASGGTGAMTYSFNGGTTFGASDILSNIPAGTYNLVAQDANGCSVTGTAVVTEPSELLFANVGFADASCFGVCNGSISVSISGGTQPRTFTWGAGIAGATDSTASNICVGSYVVIVEDANGCIINTTVDIDEPNAVLINGVTVTNVSCNGLANGSVNINAPTGAQYSAVPTGNAPVYGASNIIGGLAAGTYDISVLDGVGCPATTTATVTEPAPLTMTSTPDATVCYNRDMDLFAVASGGTAPYTYTWTGGLGTGSAHTITPTAPVSYNVSVVDAQGCSFGPLTTNIDVIPQLTGTASSDTTVCAGASVTLLALGASGLAPYQYFWNVSPTFVGDTYTVTPTTPTTYTVTIIDVCSDSVVQDVFVDFYTAPSMTITPSAPAGCSPLNVSYTANFGAGFTSTACVWNFGNGDTSMNCSVANTVYTAAGCYNVNLQVTSPEGCLFDSTFSQAACVYPDPVVDFTYNPVNVNILQPVANFVNLTPNTVSWSWDFAGTDSSNLEHPSYDWNDFEAGEYIVCLEAVSDQGCIGDTCKPFVLNDQYLVYVPNAFTPDGDGVNDIFLPSVKGVKADGYELMIFDRWGELIFQTTSKLQGWDGTFKGVSVKEDVYVWKIKAKLAENENIEDTKEMNGHVTLIK